MFHSFEDHKDIDEEKEQQKHLQNKDNYEALFEFPNLRRLSLAIIGEKVPMILIQDGFCVKHQEEHEHLRLLQKVLLKHFVLHYLTDHQLLLD